MSCQYWSEDGWGVCMDNITLKDPDTLKANCLKLAEGTVINEYIQKALESDANTIFTEVLDYLANDEGIYGNPYGWLLAMVMNEKEGTNIQALSVDDYSYRYVCVPREYPFTDYNHQPAQSKDWYKALFQKYFAYITDDAIDPDWISAYYSG